MKVNAVDYAFGKVPPTTLNKKKFTRMEPIKYDNKLRMVDILPLSGLLGTALMSFYFIRKGNLDIAMRAIHL